MKNEEELYDELVKLINEKIKKWKTERIFCIFLDSNLNIIHSGIYSDTYWKHAANFRWNKITSDISELKPAHIVISHNHPDDFLGVSKEDRNWTKKCISVFHEFNSILYDSIIITRNTDWVYSFRQNEPELFHDIQE